MSNKIIKAACGRNHYATVILLLSIIVIALAVYTQNSVLIDVAWISIFIIGLCVSITGWVTFQEASNSASWPKELAQNVRCTLGSRSSGSSNSGVSNRVYGPVIKCFIIVSGIKYDGTSYDFSDSYGARETAEDKINEIESIKDNLSIHYKPDDPSINVVYPGVKFVHYIRLLLGPAAMVFVIFRFTGVIHL
tara:strand:+ start:30 stop:605 length:576 start_codon:yes stop_codon:yes gene_type:complete